MNTARQAHLAALALALATTLSIFAGVADLWAAEPAAQWLAKTATAVSGRA